MIDYALFCKIKHLKEHDGLTPSQIGEELAMDTRMVAKWLAEDRFKPRKSTPRTSKLDPYKTQIGRKLEAHRYSATQLEERRMNPHHHVRKIVALSEIYDPGKVARAIEDAFHFQAFSCEYIANLLEQRQRFLPEPGALHLTRREDLLDIKLQQPDLGIYQNKKEDP